jgi:hypothetical protein
MTSPSRIAGLLGILTAAACAPHTADTTPARGSLPLKYVGPPTTADISARDAMTRLYIFADDSMLGRQTGYIGNVKGTDYIAGELKRLGIQPGGENGTYFQTVPLVVRGPVGSVRVGNDSLAFGNDLAIVDARARLRSYEGAQLIYGGSIDGSAGPLLPADQLAGKVVVVKGYTGRPIANLRDAAAVIYVHDQIFPTARRSGLTARTSARANDTTVVPATFITSSAVATRILGAPLESVTPGKLGAVVHGSLTYTQDPSPLKYPGRNVIGIIPGSDPALRNEYIAIGAHNDHVGIRRTPADHDSLRLFNQIADSIYLARTGTHPGLPGFGLTAEERATIKINVDSLRKIRPARIDSINNGADDDGSGSVGLLEIAEYFAKSGVRPKRSLLFVWHTGEEGGLYGSQYFTDNPTVPRSSIVGQVNIDMIGRGPGSLKRSEKYIQLLGSKRLSTELGRIVDSVNTLPQHQLDFDYAYDAPGHPERIYCRSDHWNYARFGIPIVFFSDGPHIDYHQVTDEPQYIDYEQLARVARFTRDVVLTIANLDHRLVVDQPLPDPRGRCVQ